MSFSVHQFDGSPGALKWAFRDLPDLERVIKLVPHRRVAVQAGGSLGVYPKRLARSFDAVYAFEPAQDLFQKMTKNAPEVNIIRFQAALGYHRQLVGMSRVRRDGKTNVHEGITHVSGSGPIPTLRLDDLALPVCDLVCLDTEGFELYALWGAAKTIQRCRPVLCVEINKNIEFEGLSQDQVRDCVAQQRYRFVERLHSDEVFVPEEWSC